MTNVVNELELITEVSVFCRCLVHLDIWLHRGFKAANFEFISRRQNYITNIFWNILMEFLWFWAPIEMDERTKTRTLWLLFCDSWKFACDMKVSYLMMFMFVWETVVLRYSFICVRAFVRTFFAYSRKKGKFPKP